VGGRTVVVRDHDELLAKLAEQPAFAEAKHVASLLSDIPQANFDLSGVEDPHDLETVDYFIAPGQFAVAENGAIWLDDVAVKHRVLYFIAQHLALVVPAAEVLHNMHQAYARLEFDQPRFGLFLSGPSKTADIEQSLVIGAHGARSLTVFLMQ
jgi:L-lactate dehydrogenase complex protein LldG